MITTHPTSRHALARRQVLALAGSPLGELVCESGELWVTRERDRADHILATGEHLPLTDGPVVVSAFAPSVLAIIERNPS